VRKKVTNPPSRTRRNFSNSPESAGAVEGPWGPLGGVREVVKGGEELVLGRVGACGEVIDVTGPVAVDDIGVVWIVEL
jgi:hypothetical protein